MTSPDPVPCELLDDAVGVVEAAARAGGAVLTATDPTGVAVTLKDARADVTTSADRESQAAVVRVIRSAFPEHVIVGEEGSVDGTDTEHVWFVDGLDGTSNFTHGVPWYCVSVALRCGPEVVAGAVYDPVHEHLFIAGRGRGATCNGVPLRVAATDDVAGAFVATQIQTADPGRIAGFVGQLERLMNAVAGVRFIGAPALIMSHIAAGDLTAYCERAMEAWDISAGQLLIEEAGGRVSDYAGIRIASAARTDVVASNGAVHDALLATLTAPRRATSGGGR